MALFTVKSLYVWEVAKSKTKSLQERVVLISAKNAQSAIAKAEKEAQKYSKQTFLNHQHQKVSIRVMDFFDVHEVDIDLNKGGEVFSTSTLFTKKQSDTALLSKVIDLDEKISSAQAEKLFNEFRHCDHDHHHH